MNLNKDNFKEVTSKGVVLVDFWAPWCGPCKMLSPVIDELEGEISDVVFGKVNVDDNPELAQEFEVMSIPAVFILKDGKKVDEFVGVLPKAKIVEKLNAVK